MITPEDVRKELESLLSAAQIDSLPPPVLEYIRSILAANEELADTLHRSQKDLRKYKHSYWDRNR